MEPTSLCAKLILHCEAGGKSSTLRGYISRMGNDGPTYWHCVACDQIDRLIRKDGVDSEFRRTNYVLPRIKFHGPWTGNVGQGTDPA